MTFCFRLAHRAVVLAILLLAVSAKADEFATRDRRISLNYFGLHIHRLVHTQPWLKHGDLQTSWPAITFGTWRLWDAYVAWPNLEPEPGKWNFSTLDKYVERSAAAGVQILLPLGLSPSWASARPSEKSGYKPGNAAEPKSIADWKNYVRTVALRYRGRIRHYELWNEVNYRDFYSGTQEALVELSRVAYQTLKEVDPENILVSPSVVGEGKHLAWFDDYLAKGGGKYADVISYHFYVPKGKPEDMLKLIEHVRKLMQKHGLNDRPLWNTETGWAISNRVGELRAGAAADDWKRLDGNEAAAYVARAFIIGAWGDLGRFYWYAWDNIDMGLVEAGSGQLKPAARAFDRVVKWLYNSRFRSCSQDAGLWKCELEKISGERQWIVWIESGASRPFVIPQQWGSTLIEELDGKQTSVSGISIRAQESPLLAREAKQPVSEQKP